jgi:hypothetical protein
MTIIGCDDDPTNGNEGDNGVTIDGWSWTAHNDNDDNENGISTVTLTQGTGADSNKLNISGNVRLIPGKNYGYVHLLAIPNNTNLTALKTADSFSFKCKGDGKKYLLHAQLSTVTDFCHYEYTFTAPETEETITVLYNDLKQPSWGTQVPFTKDNITRINFHARAESHITGEGAYNLTIWDLKAGNSTSGGGGTSLTLSGQVYKFETTYEGYVPKALTYTSYSVGDSTALKWYFEED